MSIQTEVKHMGHTAKLVVFSNTFPLAMNNHIVFNGDSFKPEGDHPSDFGVESLTKLATHVIERHAYSTMRNRY